MVGYRHPMPAGGYRRIALAAYVAQKQERERRQNAPMKGSLRSEEDEKVDLRSVAVARKRHNQRQKADLTQPETGNDGRIAQSREAEGEDEAPIPAKIRQSTLDCSERSLPSVIPTLQASTTPHILPSAVACLPTNLDLPGTLLLDDVVESREPCSPPPPPHPRDCTTPSRQSRPIDVLVVTPSRDSRPRSMSQSSIAHIDTSSSLLHGLQKRTSHLNVQIRNFNEHFINVQARLATSPTKLTSYDLAAKAKILKKIITAMEEHSNSVFMMEYALRDIINEGGFGLAQSLADTESNMKESIRVYEKRLRKLMERLNPTALEKTLQEAQGEANGKARNC